MGKEAEMWPLMYYRETCLKGMMRTTKDISPGGSVCGPKFTAGTFPKGSSSSTNPATRFTALCLICTSVFFQKSWIGSLMPLSALIGGIAGGPLIETIGRKTTILATAVPFIVCK